MRFLGEAEGEGFEPSSDPRARNGFRDRHEPSDLQGFLFPFASLFATYRPVSGSALAELATVFKNSAVV
jgi:hypothetical protein